VGKFAKRLECAVFRRFSKQLMLAGNTKAPECGALQALRDAARLRSGILTM